MTKAYNNMAFTYNAVAETDKLTNFVYRSKNILFPFGPKLVT